MTRRRTGPTQAVIELVLARSGGMCELCDSRSAVQIHHRLPRRMGGTRRPEVNLTSNLLHLDAEHHEWIEHNRTDALDMGLLLRDGDVPRREPATLWMGEIFLDNKGGFDPPPTCPLGCAVWTSDNPCDCSTSEET